ncbi:MAG: hydantoinase B/oxoprolinase family protein [Candidatus Schekmanbacteria bacterium]|nr:MAG: hydantoinase B/oxoprolinase family protein [Candidatus Schekmanbacteria bacterium]
MEKIDPIQLEIFKNLFSSIAEEMGYTLKRTSFSPNIKERRDYSCAIFDCKGDMVSQAAHIPVHLGSMPMSVKAILQECPPSKNSMAIVNDPFRGGTHLPDVTIIAPVFLNESKNPLFYVANRAHHSDIGGMTAGSMPISTSIFQEGVIIPPLLLVRDNEIDESVLRLITSNVRTTEERRGDFKAQVMANNIGIRRMRETIDKYGAELTSFYAKALQEYTENITRRTIKDIKDGVYEFEDYLDDDGIGIESIKIKVAIRIEEDNLIADFSGSSKQVMGSVNAVEAITLSALIYSVRCLMPEDLPTNEGIFKPIKLITEKGSVVNAEFPAAVAGGNVETSQRIVDVILGALSNAVPDKICAASQGTMNNIALGGFDHYRKKNFAYYETIGGGMGAYRGGNGESAIHSHMTNTLNTPIEALEYDYPILIREYSIRKNSGGNGEYKGGNGIVREIQFLTDTEVTVLSERRKYSPYGIFGGGSGLCGRNIVIRKGKYEDRAGKFYEKMNSEDILRIETPGGGGYGSAEKKNGDADLK